MKLNISQKKENMYPYFMFSKPSFSLSRVVRKVLSSNTPKIVKEYIQASPFDQYQIPATRKE